MIITLTANCSYQYFCYAKIRKRDLLMENMKVSIPEYDIIEFNLKLTPYQLFHSCCDGSNCDDYSMMEMHADFLIILELLSHKILHIKI